ncbi:lipoxygenase homology domain-containing protein 1-like [Pomacea canaliculata]|uniref:lipoxygenase homology domain-containing protein 1-like n=1 Tax=Pomacea canaliculata TaxID=400727 RepID=UPI000D739ACF|nr:lipoxygenase homology domain-containing protein 1-like [Pomacea canaliculata]
MWKIASVFWLLVGLGVNGVPDLTITTKTGDKEHADTNANVFIILIYANEKNSKPILLDDFFVNDFERGDTNTFYLKHRGTFNDVCAIRIYHDNSGYSPAWYLEWVKVKYHKMQKSRKFIIRNWVPTEQEESTINFVIQRTPPCSAGPLP